MNEQAGQQERFGLKQSGSRGEPGGKGRQVFWDMPAEPV